jgi:uncharacterized protein (TIGR00288 family)
MNETKRLLDMLNKVGKALRIVSDDTKKKIGIIVDGPTILADYDLRNLQKIKEALKKVGTVRFGKIITDKQISQKESEIIHSQGFTEEIVGSEVDIHVALLALELLASKSIDIIAIATTDPILFPVLARIKRNKNLAIIAWEKDITPAMESIADYILSLDLLE